MAIIGDSIFVTDSIGVATSLVCCLRVCRHILKFMDYAYFFFPNMSYQSPSCFMSSKHLLTTNATSASRHSKNNCGWVHPFPNACCRRTVSLRILGELVSTHLCVWFSEEITNKIQGKTCDVCGKTNGQILLVSTGDCNSGWEAAAPGYVQPFLSTNRDKVLWDFQEWKYWVSCQGLHNAFDLPPIFAVSSNEWNALEFCPRIMEFCKVAWYRLN